METVLDVEVYGQVLEAVIDTGSAMSWIHSRHLVPFLTDMGVAVRTYGTIYVDDILLLTKIHLEVKIRGRYIYGDFVISDHLVSDLIIGNDTPSRHLHERTENDCDSK